MTLSQVLILGSAPNPAENSTMLDARAMGAHLGVFATVIGKVINTTEQRPAGSALVPVHSVEPAIPDDAELNYHLLLQAPGREIPFNVSIWHGTVSRWGPRKATTWVLDVLNPAWRDDGALLAKVNELAEVAPTVVAPELPPVPAMPDWDNPLKAGTLGSRTGDHSKIGTEYVSPAGVKWVKGISEDSMFMNVWRRE